MEPEPLDPGSIDWDRELSRGRRAPAPSRRRLWLALGAAVVLVGIGGAVVLATRGPDDREVARERRAADLTRLRVRQVALKQRTEELDGALRAYAIEHPGDVDAVKYAADPENKIDLKGDPTLVAWSKDLDRHFLYQVTKPEGPAKEFAFRSNVEHALLAARGVIELRAARTELGRVERDIAALGEKP